MHITSTIEHEVRQPNSTLAGKVVETQWSDGVSTFDAHDIAGRRIGWNEPSLHVAWQKVLKSRVA